MTTTRPDPTPADLLTAARALLARAEAMLSEHPTAETPAPLGTYTPHRVNLTGWRDLGTVLARWLDGGRLEVEHPEHGGIYGPSALYRVQQAEPVSKPEPIGTWGGHTDWIAWSGGACPVNFGSAVQYVMRDHGTTNHLHIGQDPAENLRWNHHHEPAHPMAQNDIIAYRIITPAAPPVQKPEPLRWRKDEDGYWRLHDGDRPTFYWSTPLRAYVSQAVSVPAYSLAESVAIVASAAMEKGHKVEKWSGEPKPEPKPSSVVLTGWRMFGRDGWELWDTAGLVQAAVGTHGWACRDIIANGPETGLHGKEEAVERLLADGARWESPAAVTAAMDHDTRAINRFGTGDVAVMVDGTRRTVEATFGAHMLFTDGTWLSHDDAETAIAARIATPDAPF